MAKPHIRRYALAERQRALEVFCLGSPAALAKVRDQSDNGMAVVAAVKAGELLKDGAIQAETSTQKRVPGLTIVVYEPSGEQRVAHQPPPMPLLDVTLAPEAEPVPSDLK
jgi:hypothetical protein